ncbi:hypothetical protein EVAR_91109_1 [Eumeta japonica]|uniref:Uncharacterized protein n=1 Tax=Eumeta variegata TaxID=151549 RepID=A0A4C1SS30_EUMVA|nr:hypothetical protein EVAR_91109_1 [Eumeta japonica]
MPEDTPILCCAGFPSQAAREPEGGKMDFWENDMSPDQGRWIANVTGPERSSMTCLDGNPTTSAAALARADKMSAILKPPQGVTTTSCQSADVPTTSASISRAVCGQSDPEKKSRSKTH